MLLTNILLTNIMALKVIHVGASFSSTYRFFANTYFSPTLEQPVSSFHGYYIHLYPDEYYPALLMPIITHKPDLFDQKWLKIETKIKSNP